MNENLTKTKEQTKFKWKSNKKRAIFGFVAGTILLAFLIITLVPVQLTSLPTTNADFDMRFAGIKIYNPYSSDIDDYVLVSNNDLGKPVVDSSRSTWLTTPWNEGTQPTYWDVYGVSENAPLKPYPMKRINSNVNDKYGWVYSPPSTNFYSDWNKDNRWSTSSYVIDPDGLYTGVPDLSISIANLYSSDSNGNEKDDYDHKVVPSTLIDSEGNTRTIEMHTGYVTLEVHYSVIGDYSLFFDGGDDEPNSGVIGFFSETGDGSWTASTRDWPVLGADLTYDTFFRFQILGSEFEDGYFLNPDWFNIGNGFLEVYKRGFGEITDTEGNIYNIATLDTSLWTIQGSNDLVQTQNSLAQKYLSYTDAIDANLPTPLDETKIVNFATNNPSVIYIPISNHIDLGMNYDKGILYYKMDQFRVQSINWVQRITAKFYTSLCKPLGGQGNDPVTVTVTLQPNPPPRENLWNKLINWVADLLGISVANAQILVIVGIIIVALIIILAIFPQLLPLLWRGLKGIWRGTTWIFRKTFTAIAAASEKRRSRR